MLKASLETKQFLKTSGFLVVLHQFFIIVNRHMLRNREQNQILFSIIKLVPVDVMDMLTSKKWAAKFFTYYKTMLKNSSLPISISMRLFKDLGVTLSYYAVDPRALITASKSPALAKNSTSFATSSYIFMSAKKFTPTFFAFQEIPALPNSIASLLDSLLNSPLSVWKQFKTIFNRIFYFHLYPPPKGSIRILC